MAESVDDVLAEMRQINWYANDVSEWSKLDSRIEAALQREREAILALIAEWRKGCSNALIKDHPEACHECTAALIVAIERKCGRA